MLLVSDARWQSMILFGYFAGFCPGDLAVFPLNKLELNQNDGWRAHLLRRRHKARRRRREMVLVQQSLVTTLLLGNQDG